MSDWLQYILHQYKFQTTDLEDFLRAYFSTVKTDHECSSISSLTVVPLSLLIQFYGTVKFPQQRPSTLVTFGISNLWGQLLSGCRYVLLRGRYFRRPKPIKQSWRQRNITHVHANSYPRRGTRGGGRRGGGNVDGNPPQSFSHLVSKRFYLQWKASDLLNKMRYGNCRHLGFYQELEIWLKPREMVILCA